jgi:precorrin-2 dehydrogenase/sirohydrochlorin ferrochelatase
MDAFPAFFPLAGATVVIAGGGAGAEAKARLFEGSPARVVRLTGAAAAAPQAYAGAVLVFIDGEDDAFAQAALSAARSAGAPVNVIDRPALSDFNTPAVIDRGEVVAAIGTGGASPVMAAMMRTQMEIHVPEGAGRFAGLLKRLQGEVRAALPQLHERRAFLRQAVSGPAAQAANDGDLDKAEALLREALARGPGSLGLVRFVDGRGPGDLLTLRAVRALSSADVVAADPGVSAEVLAYARRDAERLAPGFAADLVAALAQAGRQVARVVAGPVTETERSILRGAAVTVEVVPMAAEPPGP